MYNISRRGLDFSFSRADTWEIESNNMRRETLLLQATVYNYVYYLNDFSFELFRAIFPAIYFRRFSIVLPRTMSEVDFGQFFVANKDVGTFAKEIGKCCISRFATRWQGGLVGGQTNAIFCRVPSKGKRWIQTWCLTMLGHMFRKKCFFFTYSCRSFNLER